MKTTNFALAFLLSTVLATSQSFAYQPVNPNGSATSANSSPVVIASDQATLPLPTGAATSANQTTGNTSLSSIASSTANIPASPSTSALQTTGNNSLSTIATSTSNIPTKGQSTGTNSLPVVLAAPNTVIGTPVIVRPSNTTAYAAGQMFANSATPASVTPIQFAIAPSNGTPVYILKGKLITQTSGGAGIALTNGVFRVHLYGQAPTVTTGSGDGLAFSTTLANWCGTLDGTLLYQGSDYSVAELTPTYGSFVTCTPATGSQTIYGLMEARAGFTPTSAEATTVQLTAQ